MSALSGPVAQPAVAADAATRRRDRSHFDSCFRLDYHSVLSVRRTLNGKALGPGQSFFLPNSRSRSAAEHLLLQSSSASLDYRQSRTNTHAITNNRQGWINRTPIQPITERSHAQALKHAAARLLNPPCSLARSVPERQIIAMIDHWHDQGYRDDDVLKGRTATATSLRKKRTITVLLGAKPLHSNIASRWSYQNTQLKQQADEDLFG